MTIMERTIEIICLRLICPLVIILVRLFIIPAWIAGFLWALLSRAFMAGYGTVILNLEKRL